MANYFQLQLDTTPPIINTYLQSEVAQTAIAHISIEANEPLLEYQDIYCMDSSGKRYDLTFYKVNETQFYGEIQVSNMAIGMAVLYITLKDIVGNASSQQVKQLYITEQISIQLLMDDFIVNKQEVGSVNMVMKTKESTMDLYIESEILPLLLASKAQLVCVADQEKEVK